MTDTAAAARCVSIVNVTHTYYPVYAHTVSSDCLGLLDIVLDGPILLCMVILTVVLSLEKQFCITPRGTSGSFAGLLKASRNFWNLRGVDWNYFCHLFRTLLILPMFI